MRWLALLAHFARLSYERETQPDPELFTVLGECGANELGVIVGDDVAMSSKMTHDSRMN